MQKLVPLIASLISLISAKQFGPITPHFEQWLNSNGYENFEFPRDDMDDYGSFGGKLSDWDPNMSPNVPIVFFHGNSDAALTANNFSTGWTNTVKYLLGKGYTMADLYATSWGDTNTTQAIFRDHDCVTVYRLRKFVESVLEYTRSPKIDILSHSMGVTLARKVIQGGFIAAADGSCNIGKPLNHRIRVLIGIAGANYGLCNCVGHGEGLIWPTCNSQNGLWPGETCADDRSSSLCGEYPQAAPCNGPHYSRFLMDMNNNKQKPAEAVFSMWSESKTELRPSLL
ncbi:unnamed protein product [Caenorhabditis bovis]|uniref:Uncharacterized protein n=1 Tax=Caenorhabditis bovis TaxID=2654633 RepID=A0A8S1EY09_9PELO|nr:unnamed protein product [Caenorhabditis bovis]